MANISYLDYLDFRPELEMKKNDLIQTKYIDTQFATTSMIRQNMHNTILWELA